MENETDHGWGLVNPEKSGDGNYHVVPLRNVPEERGPQPDHMAHIDECWCSPRRDDETSNLVIHHAVPVE